MGTANITTREPRWYADIRTSHGASEANVFILYGDVDGYAGLGLTQRAYLEGSLIGKGRIVARYNRAQGITFGTEEQRQAALDLLGMDALTNEPDPTEALLAGLSGGTATPAGQDDPFAVKRPTAVLAVLEKLLRAPQGQDAVAVVIDYAQTLLPAQDTAYMSGDDRDLLVTLRSWAIDAGLAKRGNPVFLLTERLDALHSDLRAPSSGIKAIEMALPTRAERLDYLTRYVGRRRDTRRTVPTFAMSLEEMANLTAGLSLRHLETIFLLAAKSGTLTHALVKAAKDEIIRTTYSDVAEMIEPLPGGFAALGGLAHLIGFFEDEVLAPIRGGQTMDVPRGILLVGPPGTGKSYVVRALAASAGFNCVALRAENILGGIVGESERKLKTFFTFVRALQPCIVFVDEIDQSDMAQRGNNSGNPVASNLFNQLLQVMSDETLRGQVVMVFASNRPDLLDPALKRNGRMDAIIPVLLPTEAERVSILAAQATLQGQTLTDEARATFAASSKDYNAADLAALVRKGAKLARRAGRAEITPDDATRALGFIRPDTSRAAWFTKLAIDACNDSEHLPPQYAAALTDRKALRQAIRADARDADARDKEGEDDRDERRRAL